MGRKEDQSMIEIKLPFYSLFVCQICGYQSRSKEAVVGCESVPINGRPDVNIGDEVAIYGRAWQGERFVGLSGISEKYSVTDLFYARNVQNLGLGDSRRLLPKHHELCIGLTQATRLKTGETRGYFDIGQERCRQEGWAISWVSITWEEFCLWRRGSRTELETKGFVEPLEIPVSSSFGNRLRKALHVD